MIDELRPAAPCSPTVPASIEQVGGAPSSYSPCFSLIKHLAVCGLGSLRPSLTATPPQTSGIADGLKGGELEFWGPPVPTLVQGTRGSKNTLTVLSSPPVPPREPVLSCRSNTYPKGFYCSWHLPTPTYIPNTFNVTVL